MNLSSKIAYDRLYKPIVVNKKGDYWPGEDFHPLKIIHVGQPTFTDNKGIWRPRQEAIELLRSEISTGVVEINEDTMISLLQGNAPIREEFVPEVQRGSFILKCGEYLLLHGLLLVFLMLDDKEKEIIRMKLGIELEEEEE